VAGKTKHGVMLSSTYVELKDHRQAVQQAMLGQQLFPIAMEHDAAEPDHDLISASLSKVEEADAYVGLISYRYGQAPKDPDRNPEALSLTELEFRRAVERKIPICMFIMHAKHQVDREAVDAETDVERKKLKDFTALAKKDRIYAEFRSVDDLKTLAVQSLVKLREAIERRTAPPPPPPRPPEDNKPATDLPPGWELLDREAIANIRKSPPRADVMIQFFDGILPTWSIALAQGMQPRLIAERLASRFRAVHIDAARPKVVLLTGAGGEGKSTAVLHAAAALVEDPRQAWSCVRRQAARAELPEGALQKLPIVPGHAWIVIIDDADNIGEAILAAVKRIEARTDIHLLLAARQAEWRAKPLSPGLWEPAADFHTEPLSGLDQEDAGRIVSSWAAWGDEAMGKLKGRSKDEAVKALLGHAHDLATRKEEGELLGALLITRQGDDMRAHVRRLVNGLGRTPVVRHYSLRDVYAMVAAMHAENQPYLSHVVLSYALGTTAIELEGKVLYPLQREAMLDAGHAYVLTRHRLIAEAACAVLKEDGEDVGRWYAFLARAARRHFKSYSTTGELTPDIRKWTFELAQHFVKRGEQDGERWSAIAREIARAVYEADVDNVQSITALAAILRRTGQPAEAMEVLKANSHRFRRDRAALYDWATTAGVFGDHGLSCWLGGRSLADGVGEDLTPKRCKLSLSGLGIAFREFFDGKHDDAFVRAQAACGHLGLQLEDLDDRARSHFDEYVANGRRKGIAELSPEQAVDAIRKAVILGAIQVEEDNDPVFFENLLGDPPGYHFTALLREVRGT
jgi:Domain of unknown function (DUF4062)